MEGRPADNVLARRLRAGDFVLSVEFVTPAASEPLEAALAPALTLAGRAKRDARITAIAVTDRVKSDDDHDPVVVAGRVAETSGKAPLVHLAGKDRDPAWLMAALERMSARGLDNALLVTGDAVRRPPAGRRVRYYDSVDMLLDARAARPAATLAAVVSPFKYREEALLNQYLKMAKKERAGADAFIAQIGWDMLKLKELVAWRERRGLRAPLLAALLLLTPARARHLRTVTLPGVVVTESLAERVARDAGAADRGLAAARHRLALQIVGARRLGCRGVQLTGLHDADRLARLLDEVDALERDLPTGHAWWDAWRAEIGGAAVAPPNPVYLFRELGQPDGWQIANDALTPVELVATPSARERAVHRTLHTLDRVVFAPGSPGARLLRPLARAAPRGSALERALTGVEAVVKAPLGCETCGFCRLPSTMFVCPETCPKGLANGACGGTDGNTCEFRDRECIHNPKYRLGLREGTLGSLESEAIPRVPPDRRGTCSWTNHLRGEDPAVRRLPSP